MDQDVLKWLATLGVGGVLAGVMFFVYRKDALHWQEAWKGQSQMLIQMVKENTAAQERHTAGVAANTSELATHSEAVMALVSRLDRDDHRARGKT